MLSGPRKPQRVAVFISGGGSTLQALLEMHHQMHLKLIVTSSSKAYGSLKARRFGKPVIQFGKPFNYQQLHQTLLDNKIECIILAGFMKILPTEFVEQWKNRIINIHPSLLPKYPGLKSAERSWNDNSSMGVTLHRVIAEMDAGPKLFQKTALLRPKGLTFEEAGLFLRRTEQHLLREMVLRYC